MLEWSLGWSGGTRGGESAGRGVSGGGRGYGGCQIVDRLRKLSKIREHAYMVRG